MSQKAQSSISTAQSPKILTPKKELVGLKKSEKSKLPTPTGWRMLVLPFRMDEKSADRLADGIYSEVVESLA